MSDIVENITPLQPNYIPSTFLGREDIQTKLDQLLSGGHDLLIQGPRGVGKTHLVRKQLHKLDHNGPTCYIPCTRYSTQYKVLAQIYRTLSGNAIEDGHHTATLQRQIEDRTGVTPLTVVLDEVDSLLLNDGNDLLYFLSRLNDGGSLILVLISGSQTSIEERLEERTYSSLYPQEISLDPYTDEELFEILADRARKSLASNSLHHEALNHIASTVDNAGFGLCWLKKTAQTTQDVITQPAVKNTYSKAFEAYTDRLLNEFSDHHQLLYQAILELDKEIDGSFQTGQVYQRYRRLCSSTSVDSLSNRRISDFLKELETLDLIKAEYYYGGHTGKTREITLNTFTQTN